MVSTESFRRWSKTFHNLFRGIQPVYSLLINKKLKDKNGCPEVSFSEPTRKWTSLAYLSNCKWIFV